MHIIGVLDRDYVNIDEVRAFLGAPYRNENDFTTQKGDHKMYQVVATLYGFVNMGHFRLHL